MKHQVLSLVWELSSNIQLSVVSTYHVISVKMRTFKNSEAVHYFRFGTKGDVLKKPPQDKSTATSHPELVSGSRRRIWSF